MGRRGRARKDARKTQVSTMPAKPGLASANGGSGGRVQFVTDKRAYLDRGARDGLSAKQSLQLSRAGRAIGSCNVETLADHQATCVGGRLRPGDTFRLNGGAASRKQASQVSSETREPTALPPVVAEDSLRTRAAQIAASSIAKVEFHGVRGFGGRSRATVTPSITIWRTQSDPNGAYSEERIDGAIQVFDVGAPGIRVDATFSAVHWGTPSAANRFRPGQGAQFYLWEAEISKRRREASTVFAVGRVWPWHTPGLTLLDGIQVGRQNDSESAEAGVYAGLIPAALTVYPSGALAGGAYGALVQTGSTRSVFRLARQEARVGVWDASGAGLVVDAEGLAQVWLGPWNLAGGGRLRRAQALGSAPVIDRAYLDVGARATLSLGAGLHIRYFGAGLPDNATLRAEAPTLGGGLHATMDAHWDPFSWLGFAGFGGVHREKDSGRHETHGAAELRLPRLLGDRGGIAAGAEVEEGWMRARLLYGQVAGNLGDGVHVLVRASASATEFTVPQTAANIHEIGAYAHLDGQILSSLRLRAWSLLRVPFLVRGEPTTIPATGTIVGVSLTGSL